MPELAEVETPKNAGFVQSKSTRNANKKRIEQDEAELKALMEGGSSSDEEADTKEAEANTEDKEETLSAEERTFKKRYSDLRSHLNKQNEELKELKAQLKNAANNGAVRPPASDESIDAWAKKYPEIAQIVETIADKKANEKFKNADARLQELDKIAAETHRAKAEDEIRSIHKDFDDLRASDAFHEWAEEQPKWVQDALYENQDDPKSVVRVIDLYKIDNGMDVKGKRKSTKEAASQVKTKRTTKVETNDTSGSFRESDVQRMTAQEYEANSDAIMESIRSGKFIYDLSGAAR